MRRLFYILVLLMGELSMSAQMNIKLTLDEAIALANDSSLTAFRYRNMYWTGYWEFRTYKAARLPGVDLHVAPRYLRYITNRYDSTHDLDVYREQQLFGIDSYFSLRQNVDGLGGTFYLNSELGYMRNFGDTKSTQFSAVPIQVGYQQNLLGYNAFKWDRRIEPLKYEKTKKQFIYRMETISEEVTSLYFDLAMAQAECALAESNVVNCDTLYVIGERRFKIASISQADLLTLRLDKVNAENTLRNTRIARMKAMTALSNYLHVAKGTEIETVLPEQPTDLIIPADKALAMAEANNPLALEQQQKVLEAERDLDKTVKESRFNASFNASIGFNQVADNLGGAYKHLLQQDLVQLSVSIPLVDWGIRKGKKNMAKNKLEEVRLTAQQETTT
ncbi:MAG: TolC family protein, partial [Bacteroidales bacterium]|nr:TolC family protein [Bacteroidales bacterium]